MLASMTGFAKTDKQTERGVFTWEVRCVNHRFFDPHFRLPEQFVGLESDLREILRGVISRGRCDIFLVYTPSASTAGLVINKLFAQQLLKQLQDLVENNQNPSIALTVDGLALLRWPGVMSLAAESDDACRAALLTSFKEAVEILARDRQREGKQIKILLSQRLKEILACLMIIQQRIPEVALVLRKRLTSALQELKSELDQDRLEQEMVYLANKIDVEEELDRFATHMAEFENILEKGGAAGRRLDFLLQELQREINTLGNKTNDKLISPQVVNIKVLIEQLREQIQNLE